MSAIINVIGEALAGAVSTVLTFAYALSAYLVLKLVFGAFRRCGDPTLPVPILLALAGSGVLMRAVVTLVAPWHPVSVDGFLNAAVVLIMVCPLAEILAGCLVFVSVRCLTPKVDLRRIKRMPAGRPYRMSGWILSVVAIFTAVGNLLAVCFLICTASGVRDKREAVGVVLVAIFGAMVQCPVVIWIFRKASAYFRYEKICAESGRTLAALGVRHAPILFLRSFKLDVIVGGMSFDEYVCSKFADSDTPILSLCDPDEDVPSGGSIKLQARDERWRELILRIIPFCRAVVMYEGMTNGLNWEIGTIRERVDPRRFFVASPPVRYRISAWYGCGGGAAGFHRIFSRAGIRMAYEFVWSRFRAKMEQSAITIPEHPIPEESLVSFAAGWNDPHVVRCNDRAGIIGKMLELTEDAVGKDCDYSELSAAIAEFERQQELPELFLNCVRRVRRFVLWCVVLLPVVLLILGAVAFAAGTEFGDPQDPEAAACQAEEFDETASAVENVLRQNDIKYEKTEAGECVGFHFLIQDDDAKDDDLIGFIIVQTPLRIELLVTISVDDDRCRKRLLGFVNRFNGGALCDIDAYLTVDEDGDGLELRRRISLSGFGRIDSDDRTAWLLVDPLAWARRVRVGVAKLVDEKVSFADAVREARDFEADADRSEEDDEEASE